ncbi:MAG TPA: hypothetical protein VKO84_08515 [Gaiellaceae bacterium]|nr:hypothetical protein [Gaiellaceae bacterium]
MKIWTLTLAAVVAISAGAFGVGQALATTTTHQSTPKTLRIVMSDPGCHWFKLGSKLTTKATVHGRVRLVNLDEAALRVMSRYGARRIATGKSIVVGHGSYVIMMVGQASDDNHLMLTVR